MTGKVPHAAFCEEYDEDAHAIIPETRQVANLTAKRSKPDIRSAGAVLIDIGSDSGYSSRTAATVNSTQSGPSGRKLPVPLKIDTTPKRTDLDRVRSHRKDRGKERPTRPSWDEKMQVGTYPAVSHHHPSMQRSPSRSRRRESSQMRHFPGTCWDCDNGLYHGSTPVESRAVDYPYYVSQPTTPSVHDYPPPSPQGPRYAPSAVQDVHVSHTNRPRSGRSYSYHTNNNNRPVSFHGMLPGMAGGVMYPPNHMGRYEHGPPPSSSAYVNTPIYPPSPYPPPSAYYVSEYGPPDLQERSVSRTRDQGRARRASIYGPPVVDYDPPSAYEDDESLDLGPPRAPRPRLPSHSSHDRDEDYYRMPPPPVKHKPTPQIIQKKRPELHRKAVTAPPVTSERHPPRSMDLSEMRDALPEYEYRRSSRETVVPARTRSIRDGRRSTSYHESSRPSRVAGQGSHRRRPPVYDYDEGEDNEEDEEDDGDEIEEKQRSAEEYQASRSGKPVPTPLTEDALYKSKASRAESDSGSQKSRSNSSRGSDARTQNGSGSGNGSGAKPEEENNNIVMMMNGVTMSFTQQSVGGKMISVRAGDTGALELNIEGKRPKKYLTNGSDYTPNVARRELAEPPRQARTDRRSDKASRRSSRSTYSGRY
ncbi:hypothetical protein BDV28DRAFT_146617 [Aspergillus coremiiformis]|uniref:Uncharacterized protein n=1 Tax=Aspergillus coremiiformis TaxID=138285 RepID=A0A5N6ZCM6_9EURO|nr:hypothetical protein BDV28DRAFT_146617 [Aspergillus coremiiformis]